MNRTVSRFWFRVVLATVFFIAIVVVQFRLVSWSLSFLVDGTTAPGSLPVSAVAAFVMILSSVMAAVMVADVWRGSVLYPVVAALPSDTRRLFVIFFAAIMSVMTVSQAGTVYQAGRLSADALAGGGDIAAPLELVPGLSFAIGGPILTALGCLLSVGVVASVFMLVSLAAGPHARTASGS